MPFRTVISNQTREILRELENPIPIVKAGAVAATEEVKDHYLKKNAAEPNKLGGKRTNFWSEVSRSVAPPKVLPDLTIRIEITHEAIAQKVHGGRIVPVNKKKLAIPLRPEAHGRGPLTFSRKTGQKLFFIKTKKGKLFLAGKGPSGKTLFFYILLDEVTQKPWPGAMPDLDKVRIEAERAMTDVVNTILDRHERV